jgi:hypothetical protein
MQDYQLRVVAEMEELDKKITALENFIESPAWEKVSPKQQVLLCQQLDCMVAYSACLSDRIEDFKQA